MPVEGYFVNFESNFAELELLQSCCFGGGLPTTIAKVAVANLVSEAVFRF